MIMGDNGKETWKTLGPRYLRIWEGIVEPSPPIPTTKCKADPDNAAVCPYHLFLLSPSHNDASNGDIPTYGPIWKIPYFSSKNTAFTPLRSTRINDYLDG
jgi:hypothetical protein